MPSLTPALSSGAIAILFVLAQPIDPAIAQSLQDALSNARDRSPSLAAARRDLAAVEERRAQARSGYFPTLDATASAGVSNEFTDTQEESFSGNANAALTLNQPLYRSGGTTATVAIADFEIKAQQAALADVDQTLLLETSSTFMDVWRDQNTVDIIAETEAILAETVQSIDRQQQLGSATRTDVAQTQSSLARTQADRIDAETLLAGSSTQFERLTGVRPERLQPPNLDANQMPASMEDAIALAEAANPALMNAMFRKQAAEKTIDQVAANYGPSVDLVAALQYFSADIQEQGGEIDDDVALARADVRVTLPLYSGGFASSRVRETREIALAESRREEDLRARLVSDTRGAWTRLRSARDRTERLQAAIEAADQALKGTERENQLGKRTTLDVLDARQALLDLQTDLIAVRRDHHVAYFELLALTGRLNTILE